MVKRWTIGISGASGMRYAIRLLKFLGETDCELHVTVSENAVRVLKEEEGLDLASKKMSALLLTGKESSNVFFHHPSDISAPIASGSFKTCGMVIIPCSMSTLGAVATGATQNLLHRAADVTLKEGRKLIIVPRETPLSAIHLENMLKLSRLGASIVPAMPGFYHRPQTIEELCDMMAMKVLDQMGLENNLSRRWKEQN